MRVPFYPQIYADKFAKKEARALLQLLAGLGLCLTFPTSPSPLRVAGVGCVQPICDPPRHNCPTDAQKKYCACVDGSCWACVDQNQDFVIDENRHSGGAQVCWLYQDQSLPRRWGRRALPGAPPARAEPGCGHLAKDLAESRLPLDWEAAFVVDHVNEQLRR